MFVGLNMQNPATDKDYKYLLELEQAITYFATSLFGQNTVDDILWDVAKNCIGRLGFEDCVIYLVDNQRKVLVQKAAYGPKNPERFEIMNPIEIPVGLGIVGNVALSGTAELINDTSQDQRYIVDDEPRLSELAVPIKINDQVLGVIDSEHKLPNFFNDGHLHILTTIASLCANKIWRTVAEQQMQEQHMQLEQARTRMAELKMQALQAQMNPHFLYNSLAVLQYFIVENDTEAAQKLIVNLSRLIRKVFHVANEESIPLVDDVELLNLYCAIESQRLDSKVDYSIDLPEELATVNILVPPMLLQPLVDNALWPGNANTDSVRQIRISYTKHDDKINATIVHNSKTIVENDDTEHASIRSLKHGWQLVNERLQLLKTKLQRTDLSVTEAPSNGETVSTITIPLL